MNDSTPPPETYLEAVVAGQMRRFPVENGQVCRIGRADRNTIVLASSQVSRDHALVDCPNGKDCVLTELGSVNGTYINGVRITAPTVLKDGDTIDIGEFRLVFRQPARDDVEDRDAQIRTTVRLVNEEITVLVVDVRGYTPLSLKVGADKLGEVMGHFFRESGALLREKGAWGQKYIGDAVMAIWVHDAAQPPGFVAQRALSSIYGIHEIATSLETQFVLDTPVRIGGGINTGFASLGNLGSAASADYTALGDAVNKAFRLESATKDSGCDVLVGRPTLAHVEERTVASHFQIKQVPLKGYPLPETCYGVSFPTLAAFLALDQSFRKRGPGAS